MSNLIRYGVPRWGRQGGQNPISWPALATRLGSRVVLPAAALPYPQQVALDSPLAYWRQGESAGTTTVDSSGNGRNGTYNGTVVLGQAGAVSGDTAVNYNGAGYSVVPAAAWQNQTAAFSVEAWVKFTGSGAQYSIVDRDSTGADRPWQFRASAGKLQFLRINNAAGSTSVVTVGSSASIDTGAWVHVVVTWDGSDIRLYINGVLDTTGAVSGGIQSSSVIDLILGANTSSAFQKFPGLLDEVAYYGTCLSAARIAAHYSAPGAPAGGAIVTGTASGTQAGTGTAVATVKVPATALGAQSGTGTAVAKVKIPATATGFQAGTGTAVAKVKIPATAAGTQAGTGTAAATRKTFATAAGTQSGAGTAAAKIKVPATAAGTQAGTGAAAASVSTPNVTGTASGTQAGTGSAVAIRTVAGTASSSSAGAGTAMGLVKVPGTAAATNEGTGSAIAIHTVFGTAAGVQAGTGSALQTGYINHHGRVPHRDPETRVTIDAAEARVPVDPAEARIPIP